MASSNGKLQAAIERIDALVAALRAGELAQTSRSTLSVQPAPEVPASPAAAPAVAAQPATAGEHPSASATKPATKPDATNLLKPKKEKSTKSTSSANGPVEGEELFAKAQLAVARVISVGDHPSGSEKLYLCRIDTGDGERQVVAGLKQYISPHDLQGRLVAVILNLKPAKLAGELSEAMILATDVAGADEGTVEGVQVLQVPEGAAPGDAIHLDGTPLPADYPKQCKSDAWKRIGADLKVLGGKATWQARLLVVAGNKGALSASGAPDGASIR